MYGVRPASVKVRQAVPRTKSDERTAMEAARELAGQVAIVTGSTRGIGRAIATRLSAEGAAVVIAGRSQKAAEAVAQHLGGDVMAHGLDVRSSAEVEEMVAATLGRWGRIDILVNNAGVARDAYITRITD